MITSLQAEQIAFFKENGYLLLAGAMDADLCGRARDCLWNSLPEDADIRRDAPATHVGPFSEKDTLLDPTNMRSGYRWQLRKTGTHQDLIDLVYSSALVGIAEQLLGENQLRRPTVNGVVMGSHGPAWPGGPVDPSLGTQGIRGIYGTLPYQGDPPEIDRPHTDGQPFMLSLVGLIADSPPDGGAFKVWPGSHRRLYPTFWMQYDQARIPFYEHLPSYKGVLNPVEYHEELARILDDTEPVDCWGSAGDVVIWHHRLVHMAGPNHSSVIRQAVLGDFSKTDLDQTRMDPPQADMWRDWSATIRNSKHGYSQQYARAQRLTPSEGHG